MVFHFQNRDFLHRLAHHEARPEVIGEEAELDSGLARTADQSEVVARPRHDLERGFIVFQFVLAQWEICDFELAALALLHGAAFRGYCHIFISRAFPDKIEIKRSTVLHSHALRALLIHEEVPEL